MSDALRDAIMRALHQATHDQCEAPDLRDMPIDECDDDREGWIGDAHVAYDMSADAVLAMPEMEAIREALHDYTIEYGFGGKSRQAEILHRRGMPESVIAWVVGHE